MLSELESLCTKHNLTPDRLIIESPDWQTLELFTRNGYYTSCYVPFDKPS